MARKGKAKKWDKESTSWRSAAASSANVPPYYPPAYQQDSGSASSDSKIGPQDSERIRRASREGMSIDVISKIWNAAPKEVLQTLEEPKERKNSEDAFAPMVKRLTTDPGDLCCPISRQLMWDPVVAEDGYTYERCNIERWLGSKPQSPMIGTPLKFPPVLNPNQHVKSAIRSFKEDTVNEILSLVPQLPCSSALELLARGEQFVRPDLPDASAQKKLTALLRLRVKLPGNQEAIQEMVQLFLENPHRGGLQKFLCELDGSQLSHVLPELDDETIEILQRGKRLQPACKWLVDQELARRLAGRLFDGSGPLKLMRLLEESSHSPHDEKGDRLKAAGLVLASCIDCLDPEDLEQLDVQLLHHARGYLRSKSVAIMDSEHFFSTDLGIFTCDLWPPASAGAILAELAFRVEDDEEKFQLLVEAHKIDGTVPSVRLPLLQHLHGKLMRSDSSSSEAEGLFLKLILEERQQVPMDVMPKLTLEKGPLQELTPEELLLLSDQLSTAERRVEGAKVAVRAGKSYVSKGKDQEAQYAFLHAYRLHRLSDDAAEGLVRTSLRMVKQSEELKMKCQELEQRCQDLEARLCDGHVTAEHTPPRQPPGIKAPPFQDVLAQEMLAQHLRQVQDSWHHPQDGW